MLHNSGTVIVRGGGDIATGIIYRLWRAHYNVLCLENPAPLVVRRTVAVAQAVFDGTCQVETMNAVRIDTLKTLDFCKGINILVDPNGESISKIKPDIVVDAIMSKQNTGTYKSMAKLVLAIGPGFNAPEEVHGVVETKRGHYMGRLITNGRAEVNTGVPGAEMGYSWERLLRSPTEGFVLAKTMIGDHVEKGDIVAFVSNEPVYAQISGVLRGLIHPKVLVSKGMKIGDIDPRNEPKYCFSITDKSLAIAGGVLEAVLYFNNPS